MYIHIYTDIYTYMYKKICICRYIYIYIMHVYIQREREREGCVWLLTVPLPNETISPSAEMRAVMTLFSPSKQSLPMPSKHLPRCGCTRVGS